MRITPLALSVFRRMEMLPACECADVDADGRRPGGECPSCEQWWNLHSHLHDLLKLPPHAFPAYEAEGDEGERERYRVLVRALDEHDAKRRRKAASAAQDGAAEVLLGEVPPEAENPAPVASQRDRRCDATAAERMRRHRRKTLHEGRAFFQFEADAIGLETVLQAAGQLTAVEPARGDIEAAVARFIATLIADHQRNEV